MTPIYVGITLLMVIATFLVVNRRGTVFALGVSLLALVLLGAAYLALAAIVVRSM